MRLLLSPLERPQYQADVVVIDDFRQVREPPVMLEPELNSEKVAKSSAARGRFMFPPIHFTSAGRRETIVMRLIF